MLTAFGVFSVLFFFFFLFFFFELGSSGMVWKIKISQYQYLQYFRLIQRSVTEYLRFSL